MATPRKTQTAAQQTAAQKIETRNTAAQGPAQSSAASLSPTEIAARAYAIWQASGRPDGRDQEHWFQAERELRGGPQQPGRSARR